MSRYSFLDDYSEGCHPKILEALTSPLCQCKRDTKYRLYYCSKTKVNRMNNDIESKSQSGSSVGFLEGARRATGDNPTELPVPPPTPNSEVHPGATRRRFTAKYKRIFA